MALNRSINYGNVPAQQPERDEKDKSKEYKLPPELAPYKAAMKQMLDAYMADFDAFMGEDEGKYTFQYGEGFYHVPATDTLSVDVGMFRDWMIKILKRRYIVKNEEIPEDVVATSAAQVFSQLRSFTDEEWLELESKCLFGTNHEFGHLKFMWQNMGRAGKANQLMHFSYERLKKIRQKDDPTKFQELGGHYRQLYNVWEDAVDNDDVFSSKLFSVYGTQRAKKRNAYIQILYAEEFFQMFRSEENGDYGKVTDKHGQEKITYVGKGKGNFELVLEQEYHEGVDFTVLEPELGRSGQFLTYFLKHKMMGLSEKDVILPEDMDLPEGKPPKDPSRTMKLHEDVALLCTKPLVEVYETLLKKIKEKYKDDQDQMNRYIEFMRYGIRIPTYGEKGNDIIEVESSLSNNVFARNCTKEDANGNLSFNLPKAHIFYIEALEAQLRNTPLVSHVNQVTFFDVFQMFYDRDRSGNHVNKRYIPYKCNLVERTKKMRVMLEPIYSMLCILDDSFDQLPGMNNHDDFNKGGESNEGGESSEAPKNFEQGQHVVRYKNGQPERDKHGNIKRGVITYAQKNENGDMVVRVDYYDPIDSAGSSSMMNDMNPKFTLNGEDEELINPYDELRIFVPKDGEKGTPGNNDDPRKFHNEEEPETDDENGDSEGGDNQDSEDDKKDAQDSKEGDDSDSQNQDKDQKGDQQSQGNNRPPMDDGEVSLDTLDEAKMSAYEKYLRDLLEKDNQKATMKEVERQKNTKEYLDKIADKKELQKLKDLVEKQDVRQKNFESNFTMEDMETYLALEKLIEPYVNEMAKVWEVLIENIGEKIISVRDKYHTKGKPDAMKAQPYFENIQMIGDAALQGKRVCSQIIETKEFDMMPRMLRVRFFIDRSISMQGNMESVYMAIMVLVNSLNSFAHLIKDKLSKEYDISKKELNFTYDVEIMGFDNGSEVIIPFRLNDFKFLEDPEAPSKNMTTEQRKIMMLEMIHLLFPRGSTYHDDGWHMIGQTYIDPDTKQKTEVARLIEKGYIREMIFEQTDGDVSTDESVKKMIKRITEDAKVPVFGMATGASAEARLKDLFGEDQVFPANNPTELLEGFKTKVVTFMERLTNEVIEHLDKV